MYIEYKKYCIGEEIHKIYIQKEDWGIPEGNVATVEYIFFLFFFFCQMTNFNGISFFRNGVDDNIDVILKIWWDSAKWMFAMTILLVVISHILVTQPWHSVQPFTQAWIYAVLFYANVT